MKSKISRRDFLGRSGKAAAGVGLGLIGGKLLAADAPTAQEAKPIPPSEKIIVGVIGCGGMGMNNMNSFMKQPDVEIAAVCDVYEPHLNRALEKTGGKATPYKDFRKLLERKDIDAVIVATPDHWHAIPTIYACQAGKDVYVEKPVAHNIKEGRAMARAARGYKRVVQVGTQQRSAKHFERAVNIVKSGKIGKVTLARCWNVSNNFPKGIGNQPDCDPPADLDWSMWLGPAPMRQYNPNRCIYDFRWFWDYAGGKVTDWGVHLIDIVHWAMAVDAPLAVAASGGKYGIEDNTETPDTIEAIFDYPGFTMVYFHTNCNAKGMDGKDYGIQFYGTNGTLFVDRSGFQIYPEGERMKDVDVELEASRQKGSEAHARNFLDCVKSRGIPVSDIEIGHRSSSAPMLANIALRTGRKIHWDGKRERIIGDKEAGKLLTRTYRKPWSI
ncbi:MAG TPA: Gfo/Idh/MocA family oxidoreductase [Armatimonadota bacterium]|nr:Gfo/Idh/MocA family oxidoreductase [Armatimonadota bacterium]